MTIHIPCSELLVYVAQIDISAIIKPLGFLPLAVIAFIFVVVLATMHIDERNNKKDDKDID